MSSIKKNLLSAGIILFISLSFITCKKENEPEPTTPTSALIYRRWIIDTVDGATTSEVFDEDTILLDFRNDQNLIITFNSDGFSDSDTTTWFWSQNPVAISLFDDTDTLAWPLINLTSDILWLQAEEGLLKCSPF
jgi:hypothetical protein